MSNLSLTYQEVYDMSLTDLQVKKIQEIIKFSFGDDVRLKNKPLLKYGLTSSTSTGNYVTAWECPAANETYISDNLIDTIVSTDVGDTSQVIALEGHTVSNGIWTFTTQTVTLNGRTPVTLITPMMTCTRAYLLSGSALNGTVSVYQSTAGETNGVPDDDDKVHNCINPAFNQSQKCATTLSSFDYWVLTGIACTVSRKSSTNVDMGLFLQQGDNGERLILPASASSTSTSYIDRFDTGEFIIPKQSHIRMKVNATANDATVTGYIKGYLFEVQTV